MGGGGGKNPSSTHLYQTKKLNWDGVKKFA